MNTTTAAKLAKVTVATIRTWCRRNVIGATKLNGRWIITDVPSLEQRIAAGIAKATRKVRYTIETMTAIGGSRWTKAGHDRVYLNNWERFIGLEIGTYKTGNISWACLGDERISNSEAGRILGAVHKVFFDNTTGKVNIQWGYGTPRSFDREDLAAAIFAGIRAEIAAL